MYFICYILPEYAYSKVLPKIQRGFYYYIRIKNRGI